MKEPLFFVHVPKTAGTSLRVALEQYFGYEQVARNYGPKVHDTTDWVKTSICENQDFHALETQFHSESYKVYTGHVNLKPVTGVFKARNIFSMIRDPLEQVVSHFNHFKRWNGYEGEIEEFIQKPVYQNVQSKMLAGIPLEMLGFVGIAENYNQSIEIINKQYDIDLPALQVNVNDSPTIKQVDPKLLEIISKNNQDDIKLHRKASKLMSERYAYLHSDKEWTFGSIGHIDKEFVGGWAYYLNSSESVSVELFINDEFIDTKKAIEFRPQLSHLNPGRNAYIGFAFKTKVQSGDVVKIRISKTGQWLEERVFE